MTLDQARELLRSSTVWRTTGGDAQQMWARWKTANPKEAGRLLTYASGIGARPTLTTMYGQAMTEFVARDAYALIPVAVTEPAPPPVPAPAPAPAPPPAPVVSSYFDTAELIIAPGGFSAFPPTSRGVLAYQHGFRRICATVYPAGDASVPANLQNWASQRDALKRTGWKVGGFAVCSGTDVLTVANRLDQLADELSLDYLLVDCEWFKADSNGRAAADALPPLVDALADRLGDRVALIGYGDTGGALCGATGPADPKPVVWLADIGKTPYFGEAYKNDGTPGDIDNTITRLKQCLPIQQVKPAVGRYDVAAQSLMLRNVWAKHGFKGFSVWDGGNLADADIVELGKSIAAGCAVT